MIADPQGTLIRYLTESLLPRGKNIDENTSLFGDRLLDSIRLVELIGFVEGTFAVKISPLDLVLENFDSVAKMTAYLRRKTGQNSM